MWRYFKKMGFLRLPSVNLYLNKFFSRSDSNWVNFLEYVRHWCNWSCFSVCKLMQLNDCIFWFEELAADDLICQTLSRLLRNYVLLYRHGNIKAFLDARFFNAFEDICIRCTIEPVFVARNLDVATRMQRWQSGFFRGLDTLASLTSIKMTRTREVYFLLHAFYSLIAPMTDISIVGWGPTSSRWGITSRHLFQIKNYYSMSQYKMMCRCTLVNYEIMFLEDKFLWSWKILSHMHL